MRPPSYYTSLANSHHYSSPSSSSNSSTSQLRSSFSSPSTSSYISRNHLPYVSQSMLVAHCITGVGSSTKPYGVSSSSSSSGYSSTYSPSSSYSSSRPASTKRHQLHSLPYSSSYLSSSSSYQSPSSRSTSNKYLNASSYSSSCRTSSSNYRPSISSYYKPIRLRERPLLTQISRQINAPTATPRASIAAPVRTDDQATHSGCARESEEEAKQEKTDEQNWSSDLARNISRNKYLIKFREIDKRPAEPIKLSNRVEEASEKVEFEAKQEGITMKIPLVERNTNISEDQQQSVALESKLTSKRQEPIETTEESVEGKTKPIGDEPAAEKKKVPREKKNIKLKIKNLNVTKVKETVADATSPTTTVSDPEVVNSAKKAIKSDATEVTTADPKTPPTKPKVKKLIKSSSKAKLKRATENEAPTDWPKKQEKKSAENKDVASKEKNTLVAEPSETGRKEERVAAVQQAKRIRFREYHIDDFNFLSVLGHGGWGFVILAELKEHDFCFAVKCIKKITIVEDDDFDSIMIERKVLTLGNVHPFICKLFCTFETPGYLFFVMEFCPGGDLMFHVQKEGKFSESRCRFYAAEIICAIRFLHNKHIIYRDLKLDNILLDAKGHIRLVDFGMCQCRTYREEMLPSNFCGTPEYISPEIIKGVPYNHSVDWWSFGVLLYEMAVGKMPFRGNDENELLWNVCYEQIHYPMFLTKELTTLLQLLLEREPNKRMGMASCKSGDIYDQPWFRGTNWRAMEQMQVPPPFTPDVNSMRDVQNFDADFTESTPELSPVDESTLRKIDQTIFQKFPYTNPNISIFG